jgi:hypothetical protein
MHTGIEATDKRLFKLKFVGGWAGRVHLDSTTERPGAGARGFSNLL